MPERPLTIADVDALMDSLEGPWVCLAGHVHQPQSGCFHPLPPAVRTELLRRAGLRKRLTDA